MVADARREFSAFYDDTWGRTVACAYAIAGDLGAAEDLAQEAYTRAWLRRSAIGEYDDPRPGCGGSPPDWRWADGDEAGSLAPSCLAAGPRAGACAGRTTVVLVRALGKLPDAQRRAIVLYHLAGFSVGDIAAIEHCPAGTVKARLSRGRAALAASLEPTGKSNVEGRPSSNV